MRDSPSCSAMSEPRTTVMPMGVGSLLATDRRAAVAWPLTSLVPKISDWGNETETLTFRLGVCGSAAASVAFSTYMAVSDLMSWRVDRHVPRWPQRH
jgi:hypothetical protein